MKKTINAGVIILSTLIFLVTIFVVIVHNNSATSVTAQDFIFDEEDATVRAIKKVIPTVVTIIIDERIENIWLNKETGQYESSSKVIQRGSGTGFLISSDEMNRDTIWLEFIQNNIKTETIYPQILCLKLDTTNLATENYVHGIVKDYSDKIIEFITSTTK